MVVIGIDCGSERTGYGIIESDGARHTLVTAGVVQTSPKMPFALRLLQIAGPLRAVIQEHHPDCAAVEEVFHAANAKTAIKLAHVRGVVLLALAEAGLTVGEYSPLSVKMSVAGYGRAEKQQVRTMVHSLLGLRESIESEDACDAIAVAVCHATHESAKRRLAGVV
jgi:crossover junction endodeoxyribonuclease RuvC